MKTTRDILRHVRLELGYSLAVWSIATVGLERSRLGYEMRAPNGTVLFEGDQFRPSPLHADDSDETLYALLAFLTLRPGDTDAEYFADYTAAQMAFAEGDAEQLAYLYADDPSEPNSRGEFEDIEEEPC
jgi:hypothetical protein